MKSCSVSLNVDLKAVHTFSQLTRSDFGAKWMESSHTDMRYLHDNPDGCWFYGLLQIVKSRSHTFHQSGLLKSITGDLETGVVLWDLRQHFGPSNSTEGGFGIIPLCKSWALLWFPFRNFSLRKIIISRSFSGDVPDLQHYGFEQFLDDSQAQDTCICTNERKWKVAPRGAFWLWGRLAWPAVGG